MDKSMLNVALPKWSKVPRQSLGSIVVEHRSNNALIDASKDMMMFDVENVVKCFAVPTGV